MKKTICALCLLPELTAKAKEFAAAEKAKAKEAKAAKGKK